MKRWLTFNLIEHQVNKSGQNILPKDKQFEFVNHTGSFTILLFALIFCNYVKNSANVTVPMKRIAVFSITIVKSMIYHDSKYPR